MSRCGPHDADEQASDCGDDRGARCRCLRTKRRSSEIPKAHGCANSSKIPRHGADGRGGGEVFERNGALTITSMGHKSVGKWRIQKDQLRLDTGSEPGGGCYEVWLAGRNVELRNQASSTPLEAVLQKPVQGR